MVSDYTTAVKLPQFCPKWAELWFVQVEAQFNICKITSDLMKYPYVVATLDEDMETRFPPGESPSFLFKKIFLCNLPPQVQVLITQTEMKDLWQLAKAADKHFLSSDVMVNTIGSAPRPGRVKQDNLCFYHTKFTKFGKKAMKCKQPCSFRTPWLLTPANSRAGCH
uniref:DUF7041 domain-containing protein n=1 Tax=Octopus bimaculoides TaxID=37653 RepID=A0A0L8FTM6_OCTBM